MIFAVLFAALLAGYWALRAVDYRTSLAAEELGALEGHASMRGSDGLLDAGKFFTRAVLWTAACVALYVLATWASPIFHGLWLGTVGVLIGRSVWAILGNVRNAHVARSRAEAAAAINAAASAAPTTTPKEKDRPKGRTAGRTTATRGGTEKR